MYKTLSRGLPEGRLLVRGEGPLANVQLDEVENTLSLTDGQRERLGPIVSELKTRGTVITNGSIYRLESYEVGTSLKLNLAPAFYFDSVLLKRYPEWGIRSKVLAVVCVTECPDGYLVEKRSPKVASLPGRYHPIPAGSIEPPAHPLETLHQEALEELGLEPDELTSPTCLGLVFGELSGIYQLVSRASTEVGYQEICERECSGAWERSEILLVPPEPAAFLGWLKDNQDTLTAAGRMALILEGGRRWGDDWFEQAQPC